MGRGGKDEGGLLNNDRMGLFSQDPGSTYFRFKSTDRN